jgi:hypothetical protein
MATYLVVKIVLILLFALIGIIARIAKSKPTPPQQNYSNPYNQNQNPYQQTPPPIQNPFQQFPQNQNPTTNETDINSLFDERSNSFSNTSTRNTNSNMGVGAESFYCMYCGKKFASRDALTKDTCFKHPNSAVGLQKHVLYQGTGRPTVGF